MQAIIAVNDAFAPLIRAPMIFLKVIRSFCTRPARSVTKMPMNAAKIAV